MLKISKEERDDPELADFWTIEELRLFNDLISIEKSNMKFVEKRFYLMVLEFLFEKTRFYSRHASARDLLWDRKFQEEIKNTLDLENACDIIEEDKHNQE